MTQEERIIECEKICQDVTITPYKKLAGLYHYVWLPYSQEEPGNINYSHIECPYCHQSLYSKDIILDSDICYIDLNSKNQPIYNIFMPCCNKEVFTTTNYNITTKVDLWAEVRKKYWQIFKDAEENYNKRKEQYQIICDYIYIQDNWRNPL